MKRKSIILSLALSGASFSTGALQAQSIYNDSPRSSVGRIGDSSQSIGDSSRYTAATPDSRPTEFRSNTVEPTLQGTNTYIGTKANSYSQDPVPMESYDMGGGSGCGCGDGSCGGSCGSGDCYDCIGSCGCWDSGSCRPGLFAGLRSRRDRNSRTWMEAGTLLWFSGNRNAPALVARNPNVGGLPNIAGDTQVLAGGDQAIGDEMMVGYRAGFGMWLDDSKELGVGGRAFGLFNRGNSQTYAFDGVQSIGIPFFDTSFGIPNSYVVGIDAGQIGTLDGSITIADKLQFFGSELYLRRSLIRSGNNRIDLVGGYLYSHLQDSLTVSSTFTDFLTNNLRLDGTVETRTDRFSGTNEFHGGNIGTLSEFSRGKWNLQAGTKFGLGNMHQTVRASGTRTVVIPNPVNTTTTTQQGLFAQTSNSGNQARNSFAFIPQIDLTMGYALRRNMRAEVGYSFLYFSDVAMAGNQIDTNLDQANFANNPVAPSRRFVTDSYMIHGLNLGLNWSF